METLNYFGVNHHLAFPRRKEWKLKRRSDSEESQTRFLVEIHPHPTRTSQIPFDMPHITLTVASDVTIHDLQRYMMEQVLDDCDGFDLGSFIIPESLCFIADAKSRPYSQALPIQATLEMVHSAYGQNRDVIRLYYHF